MWRPTSLLRGTTRETATSSRPPGVDNAPLHALANGVDGPDGVYLYSPTGGFPTATNQSTNYWVDVVFNNSLGYSIVGTITGPGAAGATVSLTGASTATTTADAQGNYSFNASGKRFLYRDAKQRRIRVHGG